MALRLPYWSGSLLRRSGGRLNSASSLSSSLRPSTHMVARAISLTPSTLLPPLHHSNNLVITAHRSYTADASKQSPDNRPEPAKPKSSTERIKVILKEYGTVAVVFHTCVSLCSLGTCYVLVSNGLDVNKVLDYFNVSTSGTKKGASTFAIAYVLHKVFLPLRAAITVGGVPLIVRKLRDMGWMKGPVTTQTKSQAE